MYKDRPAGENERIHAMFERCLSEFEWAIDKSQEDIEMYDSIENPTEETKKARRYEIMLALRHFYTIKNMIYYEVPNDHCPQEEKEEMTTHVDHIMADLASKLLFVEDFFGEDNGYKS